MASYNESIDVHYKCNVKTNIENKVFILQMTKNHIFYSKNNPIFLINISRNIALVITNYLRFTHGVISKYFVFWNEGIIIGFDMKNDNAQVEIFSILILNK